MKQPLQSNSGQRSPDYAVQSVIRACDILAAFQTAEEVLQLRQVADKTKLNKVTAFRLLSTLVSKGLLERVGKSGYRSRFQPLHTRRYRIGYAAQSTVVPFISTVTDGILAAAREAGIDLIVLNNRASRKIALRNAAQFISEKVDLVIECQIHAEISGALASMYADAGIPVITMDAPQPGATYFGADNYKAGHIAGMHLGRWSAINWQGQIDEIVCTTEPAAGAILHSRTLGALDGLHQVLPHSTNVQVFKYEIRPNFEYTLSVIRKHLRRSKAHHILVAAVNDPSALGSLQAFRDFGREHNCAIVGQGAVMEARHEIRRPGTRMVGSVAYFPETYGEKVIRMAVDILEKRMVPKVTLVHHQIVHASNVNKIYPNDLLMDMKALD
jgi:ribose transport system substrate-binding protein